MPCFGHKLWMTDSISEISKAKKITHLYEEQLAVSVGGTSLIEDRWSGHGLIECQVAEPAVVAKVDGRTGMQQVGEQHVGGELFGWEQWPAGVAAKIGLNIEELLVGQGCVIIDDDPKRQFLGELIFNFGAKQVIVKDGLTRRKTRRGGIRAGSQAVVD